MKKQFILALAVAGLAITACGDKAGYRSHKGTETITEADENTVRDPIVLKAEEIAGGEISHVEADTQASQTFLENILGLSVKFETATENVGAAGEFSASIIVVSILTKEETNCTPKEVRTTQIINEKIVNGVNINGIGKLKCLEADCNSLILMLQKSREASPGGSSSNQIVDASVAVLLSKDASGVYVPVKSDSQTLAVLNSAEQGAAVCRGEVVEDKIIEGEQVPVDADPAANTEKTPEQIQAEKQAQIDALRAQIDALKLENARLAQNAVGTGAGAEVQAQIDANKQKIMGLEYQILGISKSMSM